MAQDLEQVQGEASLIRIAPLLSILMIIIPHCALNLYQCGRRPFRIVRTWRKLGFLDLYGDHQKGQ